MNNLYAIAFWATFDVLKSVLPSVFIGLYLANLAAVVKLGGRGRTVTPFIVALTGLPVSCALSIVLAIGDRTAGMAAVAVARRQNGLSDQTVIAANLVAKAPSVLQFFIFSFIPIMMSMFPREVGVHFLVVYFLAFLLISLLGVCYSRLLGHEEQLPDHLLTRNTAEKNDWLKILPAAAVNAWRPFITMTCWMAGASFAVMLLLKSGYIHRLNDYLPVLARLGLSGDTLSLAGAGLVSMLGGVAAVGVAFHDGLLPAASVVPLLLTISLLHNFYDFFGSSLPRAIGVFGHRLGLKVAVTGLVVTQAVMLLAIIVTVKGWF
jgi:hypothetical protein